MLVVEQRSAYSGVASLIFLGGKYFYFKRAKVFCLGHRLAKHKTTRYVRVFGWT